jgi:hypothetical protein
MPLNQVSSRGLRYDVREQDEDEQVGRPGMNRTDQPAERHSRHDELNALERLLVRRSIVEQQQDAGRHLDPEQEQRHAAEVVPDAVPVNGDGLLPAELRQDGKAEALLQPRSQLADGSARCAVHARDTTTSPSATFTM